MTQSIMINRYLNEIQLMDLLKDLFGVGQFNTQVRMKSSREAEYS